MIVFLIGIYDAMKDFRDKNRDPHIDTHIHIQAHALTHMHALERECVIQTPKHRL